MTKVVIHAGACGFSVTVAARKGEKRMICLSVETECEMVKKMAEELPELDMMSVFTRLLDNPLYRSAAKHLKHVTCPVPGGILKAMEVEAGFAVPKDVSITFVESEKSRKEKENKAAAQE
jgi:hypothetical protein